ncbi:MAG: DUF6029 family protein [Saprospiraceae bacterium]|jgi:hypothetical protein
MILRILFAFVLIATGCILNAQDEGGGGRLSGRLEANGNFFQADSAIGAINTPQYDRQLYGADAWLNLTYAYRGFEFGVRFDMFNNSNLLNPLASYTDQGIGNWYIKKRVERLEITGGYIYDQIGSGTIFRSFEQRPLLIDNALFGIRLVYDINDDWRIKVLSGRQKRLFEVYEPIIRGGSIDGFIALNESGTVSLAPGAGVMARTFDDETMETIVNTISSYTPVDSIGAQYNTYAFSFFNTLVAGPFTWYIEGAIKTKDVFNDPFAEKLNWTGTVSRGKLVNRPGNIVYTSMSYAKKGFGMTLEFKRTEDFTFRANPFVALNRGMINYLPPMTRVNTYRLNARYAAATQELGELAVQGEFSYAPSRKWRFDLNVSNIESLRPLFPLDEDEPQPILTDNDLLYREIHLQVTHKPSRKVSMLGGFQIQNYNQEVYEGKRGAGILQTFAPFGEVLFKLDRKKALRLEAQYMLMNRDAKDQRKDYGNWLFALAEFSIAPHWSFTVSDMFNASPGKNTPPVDQPVEDKEDIHFPRFDIYYTNKTNRFSLSYVKQVEGIVCTGGICRLEPAFSGVKMTVNSSF